MVAEPSVSSSQTPVEKFDRGVTPRVVVFSLFLAVVLGYIIPVIDYKYMNTFLDGTHLPPGAIGALLLLVLVINPLLGLVSKKLQFTRNEALTVYITCLFSSLVPGHGAENFLVPNLIASFYFATPGNKWLDYLVPNLKPGITPAIGPDGTVNKALLDGWYLGGPIPWSAWIGPLLLWGALALAVYTMLACLSAILRKQWAQNEALAFPLLRLPLEITSDMDAKPHGERFFGNPVMWMGFGVAVFIQLMRGLHMYFPDVPTFPLELDLGPYLQDAPWNQLGWTPIYTYPIVVGIAYLLTSEVSFSLWFFFWLAHFQYIVLYGLGYPASTLPQASSAVPWGNFLGFEQVGCYFVFVALMMWTAREHLKHVVRRAFGREKGSPDEKEEVMSYPVAFWGFSGAFLFIMAWMWMVGIRLDIALALWSVYLIYAIGLSRLAMEGGMLSLLNDSAPLGIVGRLLSSSPGNWLSTANGLVPASLVQGSFAAHMRGFSMPSYLHAFKLAHDRKISPKPLLALIAATVLISFSMSLWMAVKIGYENGGLTLTHKWWATQGSLSPASFVNSMITTSDNQPAWNWAAFTFGGLMTWVMMAMRARFAWFPFHPIGFLIAQTYPGGMFWFSIFLGWLAKTLIMKFGGADSYRKMTPAFLGLALGDFAMMFFWLAIDSWQGQMNHALLPQ
ncbi:hypothetical protein B1R32_10556 [Abditibacterium utsteinense]|uniref:Uncharacterized protein n=1 Tax=Abditibacterium utsteinense TaxID=1960156 RepID=A0A2S8SU98_9BACT|nr:DUF6785 family protein [Abditibacterium utsteinense]PQV64375.1 hypothetical protein B1R32_10556 [Abditibacterium utsteinense]